VRVEHLLYFQLFLIFIWLGGGRRNSEFTEGCKESSFKLKYGYSNWIFDRIYKAFIHPPERLYNLAIKSNKIRV